MKLEADFIESIDCKFPYHDKELCLQLIEKASRFSSNAMFAVIEEICRIPYSEKGKVSADFLFKLLDTAANQFEHPVKHLILDASGKIICGQELSVADVISKMEIVGKYPGQYAALSILYFSCDDKYGEVENFWNTILKDWN